MVQAAATRRVILIGFMGAGKTTVGRVLAARLRWDFCDLDQTIENRHGQSVADIFADHGEAEFRQRESAALLALLAENANRKTGVVIALGGGAFVRVENRAALEHAGAITIWLDAPLAELERRCAGEGNSRPLAKDEQAFAQLFRARQSIYQLAQHRVMTLHKSPDQVAEEIERILAAATPREVTQ